MPLSITTKTVIATYHHARQSDLDPTPQELRAWLQILQSNYELVLPAQMSAQSLDPNNAGQVDLALLLSELTEESGFVARARRGCAVLAGLIRAGTPVPAALAVAAMRGAAPPQRTAPRRTRKSSRTRSRSRKPA